MKTSEFEFVTNLPPKNFEEYTIFLHQNRHNMLLAVSNFRDQRSQF